MYKPQIGDIICNDVNEFVVLSCDNREDMSSVCFDRIYYLIPLDVMESYDGKTIDPQELQKTKLVVKSVHFPEIKKSEKPPFIITPINMIKVKRRVAKQITIYE